MVINYCFECILNSDVENNFSIIVTTFYPKENNEIVYLLNFVTKFNHYNCTVMKKYKNQDTKDFLSI